MPSTKTNMTPKITATRHELIFFASPVIFLFSQDTDDILRPTLVSPRIGHSRVACLS